MLTLYRFPGATCAAKVLLALHEKAVAFEDRVLERNDLASDWYRRLNPNGVVPTVTHVGATIIESSVILNYLEDAFPGPALRPAAALPRARMNHWLKVADDALGDLGVMTYAIASRRLYLAMPDAAREAYYRSLADPQTRAVRRSVIELGLDAPEVGPALAGLRTLQWRIDQAVEARGCLLGDYSLADAAITPFAARLEHLGLLMPATDAPGLHRWWRDIRARPSFDHGITRAMPNGSVDALRAAAAAAAGHLAELQGA